MFNFFKSTKTTEEKLVILKCSAKFCETCEEMVFCDLKKCDSCGNKNICPSCKIDDDLCKECNKEVDEFFNNLEKLTKNQEEDEFLLKNHVIVWGNLDDLP